MHGISSGQFYTWRKQFRTGALTGFVPVSLAPDTPALLAPMSVPVEPQSAAHTAGNVEVELPNGIKLRLTGDIDAGVLRQILAALR